jgi:hypothetical protein
MKVKELISKLQQVDENLEVVLASDAEGNHFHCLASFANSLMTASELRRKSTDKDGNIPVVVLWPED